MQVVFVSASSCGSAACRLQLHSRLIARYHELGHCVFIITAVVARAGLATAWIALCTDVIEDRFCAARFGGLRVCDCSTQHSEVYSHEEKNHVLEVCIQRGETILFLQ